MSTFTLTLSEIMEDVGVDTVDEAVPHASVFGLNIYPIFDEKYRDQLNRKIIARFWNREIGHEDEEMFRFRMQTVMSEEMPYYNKLYLSEQIKFDPMKTIGIENVVTGTTDSTMDSKAHTNGTDTSTGTTTGETDGTSLANTSKNAGSRAVSSIMPQTHLSGNGDYADSANDQNSNEQTTASSNTGATSNENRTASSENEQDATSLEKGKVLMDRKSTTDGFQALPSQLLQQYRDTILNIDMQILQRLEKLFMSVTSNGDEYFYRQSEGYYLPTAMGWY